MLEMKVLLAATIDRNELTTTAIIEPLAAAITGTVTCLSAHATCLSTGGLEASKLLTRSMKVPIASLAAAGLGFGFGLGFGLGFGFEFGFGFGFGLGLGIGLGLGLGLELGLGLGLGLGNV